MKKYLSSIFTLLVTAFMGLSLVACSEDDLDTNQYKGGVTLNAWGANPVMRGGVLRFVGSNLDQIKQIEIPGCSPITNIDKVKSGVPSEIRITVPKDGPVVGFVKLISNTDAAIQTTTMLEYTEPIEFTGFAPATVMPGDVLTITGDYLDHIGSLAFAGGVVVPDSSFVEHTRYSIKLVVPDAAKTGRIELYDVNIVADGFDATQTVYNIMPSEEILTVGLPVVNKMKARNEADLLGSITAKAGEQVTISGSYLKLISAIKTGDVETELNEPYEFTEFTCNDEGTQITFTLPAEAPDGSINLITKSGVEIPVGQLVTVAPTEVAVAPNPVKNGQMLTISGKDLDVVSSVIFPNSEAIEVTTAAEIKVVVPETAQDGEIVLLMKNGKKVNAAYKLVLPTVTKYSANPVSAGGALSIEGTDLDLVKTVTFNGSETPVEVTAENDGTIINLTVPMDAQTGAVTLNLKNGVNVTVKEINVQEAVFCYATALPEADDELKAGQTMTIPVKNQDKLTAVEISGANCQYIVSGSNLIIGIPDNAKAKSVLTLISSNGKISYDIAIIPNTEVTTKLWEGLADLGSWSINWQVGDGTFGASNPKMFADMGLVEGDVIRIYGTALKDFWQVQFFDGHWGGQTEIGVATGLNNGNNINANIYDISKGYIEIPVTAKLAEQLTTLNDWGYCWIIQGEAFVISKITVTHYTVLETDLWKGELDLGAWSINWQVGDGTAGAGNPKMFADADIKPGQTIRVYVTPKSDWWQIQFFDGHWGGQEEIGVATGLNNGNNINPNIYTLTDKGCIEIPVTAKLAEQLTTLSDWGYCWIIQGENLIVNKITIE